MRKSICCLLGSMILAGFGFNAFGKISITPASGGTSISADTAANAPTPLWTSLGPITIAEPNNGHKGDFNVGTNLTLVLRAPAGFEFNTAVTPNITFTANRDITSAEVAVGANTVTITFTVADNNGIDSMTIGGTTALQVRPTSTSPLASGRIHRPSGSAGGTAKVVGLVSTSNASGIANNNVSNFGTLTEVAGAATQLGIVVQPSTNAVMGIVFGRQPVIGVQDVYGNVRTNENGTTITAEINSGSGSLLGTTNITVVNGIATYTDLAASDPGVITIGFSSGSLTSVTSLAIDVAEVQLPAVPTSLAIQTQPSATATAGVAFAQQPVVVIKDQYDFVYTNDSTTVVTGAVFSGSGTLQGTVTAQVANGVATFSGLSHNVANTITLQFTSEPLLPVVSEAIVVSPATADRLAFSVQPGSAIVDKVFGTQPVVVTEDQFGNDSIVGLGTTLNVTVALTSGTGVLSGTKTIDIGTDFGSGSVSYTDLQIDTTGDKQLTASAGGLLSGLSSTFTVSNGEQTITFGALANKVYGDAPFTVSATASSGLPVSFSVLSGPATITNSTVTITGVGDVTIRASQAGDGDYFAAPDVDQTFTVSKGDQTITFGGLANKVYTDAPFNVTATASSGLSVSFSILSGPATISGNTVTITGTGDVTVRASQDGDSNYNAASNVDQTFTVSKANQTITFGALGGKTFGDAPFTVSATASSGLSVDFSIVSGPATIIGDTVTITGTGDVTVRASQSGNTNYNAAVDVDQTFTVGKAEQTITFGALGNKVYGDAPFAVSATSSSGLAVSFSILSGPASIVGDTITITGAGDVTVRASQSGNTNYNAAVNVDQSFTVAKANQTITFGSLASKTYGDAPFAVSATASSGLTVSFSILSGPATIVGDTITITGAGDVTVRASQAGNVNYNGATDVDQTFTVAKANQTITFGSLSNKIFGDAPFTVDATASSGLAVTFSILSGPATISGSTVTITNTGTVTVRAEQAGDTNYNAATAVDQSFDVVTTTQTITFDAITNKVYGDASFTVSASASSALPVTFSILSGPASISNDVVTIAGVGTVTIQASQAGSQSYDPASTNQTFEVTAAQLTITVDNKSRLVGFSNPTFTGSLSGVQYNDNITATYDSAANTGSPVGTYDIVPTISDPDNRLTNYTVVTNVGILTVQAIPLPVITLNPLTKTVKQGGSATFTAGATGVGIGFQWRHNGVVIPGATSTSFTIPHVHKWDNGVYRCRVTNSAGLSLTTIAMLNVKATPADFDENGSSDIPIQNADGSLSAWMMNGTNFLSALPLAGTNKLASGWTLIGQGDFTGEGHIDLLFQHTDRRIMTWNLSGRAFNGQTSLLVDSPVAVGWKVVGVADMNRNYQTDILLQHTDGRLMVLLMYRGICSRPMLLQNGTPADAGWKAVAVRDFNGDGKPDILFQQDDGRLAVWMMNDIAVSSKVSLKTGPAASTGWKLTGAADITGDGKTDILWQNTDGSTQVWQMNYTQFVKSFALRNGTKVTAGSQIAGPR